MNDAMMQHDAYSPLNDVSLLNLPFLFVVKSVTSV